MRNQIVDSLTHSTKIVEVTLFFEFILQYFKMCLSKQPFSLCIIICHKFNCDSHEAIRRFQTHYDIGKRDSVFSIIYRSHRMPRVCFFLIQVFDNFISIWRENHYHTFEENDSNNNPLTKRCRMSQSFFPIQDHSVSFFGNSGINKYEYIVKSIIIIFIIFIDQKFLARRVNFYMPQKNILTVVGASTMIGEVLMQSSLLASSLAPS